MGTRVKKYEYFKVIQQNYGFGWEDVSFYPCESTGWMNKEGRELLRHDLKEYCMLGYSTRVIKRRELIKADTAEALAAK